MTEEPETLVEFAAKKLELLLKVDGEKLEWLIRRHREGRVSSDLVEELDDLNFTSPPCPLEGTRLVDFWLSPFLTLSRARGEGPLRISEIKAFHESTSWKALPFETRFLPAMQDLDAVFLKAANAKREALRKEAQAKAKAR